MIIEKIKVENFATYKKAELNLNQLGSTISVFGSTGAGKTTFFVDAITLALYGRAYGQLEKKYAKYVIPTWSRNSKVEIDFSLPDGSKYRVTRILSKERESSATLYKLDENGRIKEIIATGIRTVEKELNRILGIDFKTFINTIVVRQGRVAELISRDITPSERRNIFLKAFDIDFTKHKEKAKELHDKIKSQLTTLQRELELILKEISQEKELKLNAIELETKLIKLKKEITQLKKEMEKLEKEKNELQEKYIEIKNKISQLEDKKNKLNELKEKLEKILNQINNYNKLINQKNNLENEFNKLKHKISLLEKMVENERKARIIEESIKSIRQLVFKRDIINRELRDTISKINDLNVEVRNLQEELMRIEELNRKLETIKIEISNLNGYSNYIEQSIDSLKINMKGEVKCPVCKTILSRERAEETINHLNKELNEIRNRILLLENEKRKLQIEVNRLKILQDQLRIKERELAQFVEKRNQLSKQLSELDSLMIRLREYEIKISELLSKFNSIAAQYRLFFGESINFGEAEVKLENCRRITEEVSGKLMEIKEISGKIEGLIKMKNDLERDINELEFELNILPKLLNEKSIIENKLKNVGEKLEEIKVLIDSKNKESYECNAQLKQISQMLRELEKKKIKLKDLKNRINELEKRLHALNYLYRYIFHEKGLPLILLRTFLERVEYWADYYVSRFLPGKSIRIDIHGDEVSIIVYDGATIRDLTTYSGGEMVLLGFAIRLGIARTLAEKAGITPHFLIIDEGFGPLSSEFREELLKTLNELQRDYEKIIVISHVDEVKESPYFESQIHVYKDDRGISHLEVLG